MAFGNQEGNPTVTMMQNNGVPAFLSEMLRAQYGENAKEILTGYACVRPVTFRVNTLKTTLEEGITTLSEQGIMVSAAPVPYAFIAENANENKLSETSLYQEGKIYLQSLSSMLPPFLIDPQEGESILDMTAAPGGKTCELSALSGGKALLTAVEKDKLRFERLAYNLKKQGVPRVSVLNADALKLDEFFRFDKILLDAPCSGSGTLSLRSPVKISQKLVENSAILQEKLLNKAIKLLKKGGTLVYSTCSVLKQENEEIVKKALKGGQVELVACELPCEVPKIQSMAGTVCVPPTPLYEGFFLAKLKKRG